MRQVSSLLVDVSPRAAVSCGIENPSACGWGERGRAHGGRASNSSSFSYTSSLRSKSCALRGMMCTCTCKRARKLVRSRRCAFASSRPLSTRGGISRAGQSGRPLLRLSAKRAGQVSNHACAGIKQSSTTTTGRHLTWGKGWETRAERKRSCISTSDSSPILGVTRCGARAQRGRKMLQISINIVGDHLADDEDMTWNYWFEVDQT
eukprot:2432050-Rhodomonas_salina.2